MSIEVEPIDRRILDAAADDNNDKHGLVEASPSPSHNSSSAGSSLHEITTTLKHPLRASYKEWLSNWFEISVPAIGFLGCQLSLALQNGFVTPELEELGISAKLVNYCWLAPPITGTIVQPLIGITSDMMDPSVEGSFAAKHGRRRPFVALGCGMTVVFLLLFSNARYIGLLFGDDGVTSTSNAAIIAVVSFWFLDISINVVQAPLRALVSDIIPTRFHTTANGVFGFANGLGSIIGYALGYYVAYNPKLGGNLSALFGMAAFTVVCTSVIMLYLTQGEKMKPISSTSLSEIIAKNYAQESYHSEVESQQLLGAEAPGNAAVARVISDDNDLIDEQQMPQQHLQQQPPQADPQLPQAPGGGGAEAREIHQQRSESDIDIVLQIQKTKFQRIKEAVVNMPLPISRAFMVQFWLYFGLFSSYIYLTDWFGKRVTHGSPQSDDPEQVEAYRFGVRLASIGLSFGAIFAVFGSMLLPVIIGACGYRWTWFCCMLFYGVMMLMTPFCNSITMGLVIVTCLGIGQAAAMVIGWSIVTETVAEGDQKGVYTTLFTTSHTVPELLVALTAGVIIHVFDDHVSAVLAVGGVAALFGANSALYIVEPKKW
eukprot:CAMPEP_0202685924 /NCGR_PEP_ID=MMETSP1385-20130828/1732_1 /ASSEMBLY_ACC=CAM_ASM_000861 /TAXON_ID=933848 /ORGANISM="Elphidium margaritaceum" /LENGTH=599 /DNA_ID=CAMNT_0049340397 /DNA_START=1637 /DNA_END=3433 /DNA_ORIENTATION=+